MYCTSQDTPQPSDDSCGYNLLHQHKEEGHIPVLAMCPDVECAILTNSSCHLHCYRSVEYYL